MKPLPLFLIIALLYIISSCSLIGFNFHRKTPTMQKKYPVFTEADTLKGSISQYRKNFDINYYEISIDVNIEKKYITGFVDMYFDPLVDLDTIQIDLYKNMTLNKIQYQQDSLAFIRKYDAVYVLFKHTIKQNEKTHIRVFYEGSPLISPKPPWKGGFVWEKDKNKNPWIGVVCELDGSSLWWPSKDHLYDKPDSLKMNITVPEGLFCVSNGRLIKREKIENKETFSWKTTYPINTYNATLYIGNFKHFTLPYDKNDTSLSLDFYVLPYDLDTAKKHFVQAADIIHFYERTFGEYPWKRDGYKLIESPYQGMEHQTAIAFGNKFKDYFLGFHFDYIILHETAHEWWGNSVTARDYADIWLHESFATYSEALYVEKTEGYDAYLNYIYFYSIFIKNKRPIIGPYDVCYWRYKDGDIYSKGALALHTLRNIIENDSLFFNIIKTYYNKHKYSIVTTSDFINIVNEKTHSDFKWFFDQYLYSRVCPQFEWNIIYDLKKKPYEMLYRWSNANDSFNLPVFIRIGKEVIKLYPSSKKVQSIRLNFPMDININESYIAIKRNYDLYQYEFINNLK